MSVPALPRRAAVLAVVLHLAVCCPAQRKALIIGIDGCRPDALIAADAPVIDNLMATGIYTLQGNTHPPTWSGPGWSSMLTGVWEQKHGVKDDTYAGADFNDWPHFIDRLKAEYPAMYCASIVHWGLINTQILMNADLEQSFATDAGVASAAVDLLTNGDPDVVFLQFDDVEAQGELYGFDPSVSQYVAAIGAVDTQVGQVVQALSTRPPGEEWLVVVTTDHGGVLTGHGGITPDEQRIFTILSSPLLTPEELKAVKDTVVMGPAPALNSAGYVRVVSNSAYQFGTSQDLSIECRVKMPASWTGAPVIISNKNAASGTSVGFAISTPVNGPSWKINLGDGADRVDLTGLPINDGQWHHIAMTCDRDGKVRIFQDGLFLRETGMTAIGNLTNALQLNFGQDGTAVYPTAFPGSIAEVRIWNAALSIKTVSAWSCKALSPSHPNWSSLIGHWEMDEGSGTTLANSVTGASSALLIGAGVSWQPGGALCIATDLSLTPSQVDLPPTVVKHLGLTLNPGWDWDGRSLIPVQGPLSAHLRTRLQGPDDGSLLMRDDLRYQSLVPLEEPYTGMGFLQTGGGGGETVPPLVLEAFGANAIVDWVLVELRDTASSNIILATRSCLLQRDGDVVDVDGVSDPVFNVPAGMYFVAIRHRDHLGAMTAAPVAFAVNDPPSVHFDDPLFALYGSNAMTTIGGHRAQWAGEIKRDARIKYAGINNDRDRILLAIGGIIPTATITGYHPEDINFDGVVRYTGFQNDRDIILQNIGGIIPTAIRVEQLP